MRNRHYQLDVTGTLAAHFLFCHLYTATVTHDALVANALILATGALIIFRWTKDALAEQTIALRLISTVVDGLRLRHLSMGVLQNLLG